MLDALRWLLAVEIIGLAAFPLSYYLLPRLADRGFTLSKPFGILLVAYIFWALGLANVPSVQATAIAIVLLLAAASAVYVYRSIHHFRSFLIREWRTIAIAEAIFLLFFIGWTLLRAYDPFINHTEQPMDLALLNASINSQFGHPEDPWLRGEPVSYYYFGYWMMGALTQIAGIQSNISYNLAMSLIPAMAAVGIFGIAFNMVRSDMAKRKYAIIGGIAAALLLGVAANLEGVLEFMRSNGMGSQGFWDWIRIDGLTGPSESSPESWTPTGHWWWFRASRVINTFEGDFAIDNTIQEFPFFSFILGDLHPHVMSIPFITLFIGVTLNLYRLHPDFWRSYRTLYPYAIIIAAALVLGGLGFNNLWDMPTFAALMLGILALKAYRQGSELTQSLWRALYPVGIIICLLAVLMYSPYLLNIHATVDGIGTVDTPSRPIHLFIVWGLMLTAIVPFLLATFWQTKVQSDWKDMVIAALILSFAPWAMWAMLHFMSDGSMSDVISRLFAILPLSLLAAISVYNTIYLAKQKHSSGKFYANLLTALGLGLIIGAEFLFISDFFGNRGNTVFKLYYQAWILFAAASAFAVYHWLSIFRSLTGWRSTLATAWAAAFLILLAGSLYYPLAALNTKPETPHDGPTLDGLAYVQQGRPAEYNAIAYLQRNAPQDAAIVEAVGEWFDWGLISRSTGLPTIVNWIGHEKQWRGGWDRFNAASAEESRRLRDEYLAGREAEVALIYTTQDAAEAQRLLTLYDVQYVYVGHRERERYGIDGLPKFDTFMDAVFTEGDVVIYRTRG